MILLIGRTTLSNVHWLYSLWDVFLHFFKCMWPVKTTNVFCKFKQPSVYPVWVFASRRPPSCWWSINPRQWSENWWKLSYWRIRPCEKNTRQRPHAAVRWCCPIMLLENSFHSLCYFLSAWIDELLFLFHISVDQTGVELFLFASSFLPEDVIF